MHSMLAFLAASFLVSGVAAQTFPAGFNPGNIEPDQKSSWCQAQLDTCPKICGGFYKQNRCDSSALTWECTCSNGTVPDVASYKNTLPFFICEAAYGQCIEAHPNDAAGQKECKDEQKKCGSLEAESVEEPTTTASTTSEPTETKAAQTSGTEAATTTTEAAAATSNPAVALRVAEDYSTGIMAAAFLAAFRLLL
ncbi:hypothetical protein AJ80_00375 [Polytolypa hystricis UAMH7299]|uniref:DUF7707 domain-containing protein n=1 Tax=Polytolypa hystricis (strain UAMH7299) TaxID=1447883 RepID=A0A2B7Z2I2_POLH7|nr:hypothetical protein AJ80_00375 [Polytolypa hystricis UAMH7299]